MRYRVHPDALANRIGDQMVVVQLQSDRIFELNRTGARIWELIAQNQTKADIVKTLTQEFDVSDQSATAEFDQLVNKLSVENLITIENED